MLPRLVVLAALATSAVGSLQAQERAGFGYPSAFVVRQTSWWSADGLPASDVLAHDTTIVFRPDSAHGWPAYGMVPAAFSMDPGPRLRFSLAMRQHEGIWEMLVSAEEAGCGQEYADAPTSALAVLTLMLATPVHAEGENERTLPVLTFGACDDSVEAFLRRTVRFYRPDSARGRPAFLFLEGDLNAAWRVERNLEPHGIPVRASLRGSVSGRVHVSPAGVVDSMNLDGSFRGFLAYTYPWGGTDTVYGTWVVELAGAWGEDPQHRRNRLMEYFIQHGRYPPGEEEDEEGSEGTPFAALVEEAANGEPGALDSLILLRANASDPKSRSELEEALRQASGAPGAAPVLLSAPERMAPQATFSALGYDRSAQGQPFGVDVARLLVRELAPITVQRRRLVDREYLGSAVLALLSRGRGFVAEAGPVLEVAAKRAHDPMSRDLLWFAAYQSNPAHYRDLVAAAVDSIRGCGPIVRAWLAGDGSLTSRSWGVEAEDLDEPGVAFPGVDGPPDLLAEFLQRQGRYAGALQPLQMRFTADGRSLERELRDRFERDTVAAARPVLARYLETVGDSTARPWLRGLLDGPAELRDVAYELIPPDTVRDAALVSDLQTLLIGYIAGRLPIPDSAGGSVAEPWVHDERPDLRILASDGILPAAIEPWRRLFDVMTMDSVRARVAEDGLQMAWMISPLTRTGDRYYVSIALAPVGAMCLCGGGVNFTLERRDGRWVAISAGRWIS
jgi:hypothetical protein